MNKQTRTITGCYRAIGMVAVLLLTGGCKEYVVTPPPIPSVSFKSTDISITESGTYYVEIEASETVGAYGYPVYLRLEGDAVASEHFSHSHPVYEDSEGHVLLQAMVAQGSIQTAFVVRPITNTGPAELVVHIMPDQEGNRYTVAQRQAVATIHFTN